MHMCDVAQGTRAIMMNVPIDARCSLPNSFNKFNNSDCYICHMKRLRAWPIAMRKGVNAGVIGMCFILTPHS